MAFAQKICCSPAKVKFLAVVCAQPKPVVANWQQKMPTRGCHRPRRFFPLEPSAQPSPTIHAVLQPVFFSPGKSVQTSERMVVRGEEHALRCARDQATLTTTVVKQVRMSFEPTRDGADRLVISTCRAAPSRINHEWLRNRRFALAASE